MAIRIAGNQARRLTLTLQGLADPPRRKLSADSLLALIERIGYVQVDSVNVVARAHHMILFARNQTYRPALLQRLVEKEGRLFENWTHDAAIIPTRFYPYWRVRFERERERLAARYRKHFPGHDDQRGVAMLEHIRHNGAVMARDFNEGLPPRGGFWDWHPDKAALELLWRTGHLTIARRQGFQKVYDLAERVLPAEALAGLPSHEALVDWACRGALDRLGFATPGQIARFWDLVSVDEAKAWCGRHAELAVPALVETVDGSMRQVVARADIEEQLATAAECPQRVRVLSPFDPLLRDRKRLMALFGFDYRIEIFVPEAKRQWGYYVYPLLEGDRMVGRIEVKSDRVRGELSVHKLWPEPGVKWTDARQSKLEAELDRLARLVGATDVVWA
jgi:uncharacterized protein YcaQ